MFKERHLKELIEAYKYGNAVIIHAFPKKPFIGTPVKICAYNHWEGLNSDQEFFIELYHKDFKEIVNDVIEDYFPIKKAVSYAMMYEVFELKIGEINRQILKELNLLLED